MAGPDGVADMLELGLKASAMRAKAVAGNIANIDTPDYRRKEVRFEELLVKALRSGGSRGLKDVLPEVFEPQTTAVDGQGNDVNLDQEIGELVKNSARYQAYVRLLNRFYKQMDMAIGAGQ
jgi:flagellar basal-body rod protein FlgB